jgi:WD40 repeat protein
MGSCRGCIFFACLALVLSQLIPTAAAQPSRTDSYGDALPESGLARLGTLRFRPGSTRAAFALSPDGKTLATGEGGKVRLFDMATGKEIRTTELPGVLWVFRIAFSPDGKLFVAQGDHLPIISRPPWDDDSLSVVEVTSGKILHRFHEKDSGFGSFAFTPDSKCLATRLSDHFLDKPGTPVILWNVATGKEVRRFPEVLGWALSPDGSIVAGARKDGGIVLWETGTGKERTVLLGFREAVRALAFSPDGKILAAGGEADPGLARDKEPDTSIRLWDVATGDELRRCNGHALSVRWLEFSPDGQTLASQDTNGNLFLWETATGKERQRFTSDRNTWRPFAFTAVGKTLLWCENDSVIREWDIAGGKELRRWGGLECWITGLALAPDGKLLVSRGEAICFWDLPTGKEIHAAEAHRTGVRSLLFSPAGDMLASVDEVERIRLWEPGTGKPLPPFVGDRQERVLRAEFSPDGKTLTTVTHEGTVRLWEVATGKELRCFSVRTGADLPRADRPSDWPNGLVDSDGHFTRQVVFSDDKQTLAVVGDDHVIHLWDIVTGKETRQLVGHEENVWTVRFSPDGKFLVSEGRDAVRLWDVGSGKEVPAFLGKGKQHGTTAFAPDSKLLAWEQDARVRLWDLTTARELPALPGHEHRREGLLFQRDSSTLVSAGDETVSVWDIITGQRRRKLTGGEWQYQALHLLPLPGRRVLA